MSRWFQKLKNVFEPSTTDSNKRTNKFSYLLIIGLIGLFILLVSNIFSSPNEQEPITEPPLKNSEAEATKTSSKEGTEYDEKEKLEESYERDLEKMIENIQGVTNVEVMVNVDSTNVKVFEKNIIKGAQTTDETDTNGGQRKVKDRTEESEVVLIRQGEQEVPILVQTKKPDIRGVFIVANGVEDATKKMWVIESVAKVLGVPPHRISVMPK